MALAILTLVVVLARSGSVAPPRDRSAGGAASKPTTTLVMTVRSSDLSRQADTMALFSIGGGVKPYVMLIPSGTLTDIPGYGFDMAGRALSFGRIPLADVTVENMLGVRVDHTIVIEQAALGEAAAKSGGITVTVKDNLFAPDGQGRLVPAFAAGAQTLSGRTLERYLTYVGSQENELSRLERQRQVWEGLFARFAGSKASQLAGFFHGMAAGLDGNIDDAETARTFAAFAALPVSVRTYDDMPVSPAGGADDQAFKVNDDDLVAEVQRYLSAERTWTSGPRPRLQLLNGNGVPEAGASVAAKLVPAGFYLVDTGNSRSFDYSKTKIVIYSGDEAWLKIAEQLRGLLGRGEIEIERRSQTAVDVTVVIGRDLPTA